ncbi:hypothetical protein E3N88_25232 [Mikania micrantha]|uniref:Uncharacterized protein n=1 Tax=Mikania micrantha TaxID=192012 RepID=A0A5N6N4F2_9ASTR|nr:hypothetical protein E3N88_25232 [Mikania micrantha]
MGKGCTQVGWAEGIEVTLGWWVVVRGGIWVAGKLGLRSLWDDRPWRKVGAAATSASATSAIPGATTPTTTPGEGKIGFLWRVMVAGLVSGGRLCWCGWSCKDC